MSTVHILQAKFIEEYLELFLNQDLVRAAEYIHTDIKASLNKTRLVLEKVISKILEKENNKCKGDLFSKIDYIYNKKIMDNTCIYNKLHHARIFGNKGSHSDPVWDRELNSYDAQETFTKILHFICWYANKYEAVFDLQSRLDSIVNNIEQTNENNSFEYDLKENIYHYNKGEDDIESEETDKKIEEYISQEQTIFDNSIKKKYEYLKYTNSPNKECDYRIELLEIDDISIINYIYEKPLQYDYYLDLLEKHHVLCINNIDEIGKYTTAVHLGSHIHCVEESYSSRIALLENLGKRSFNNIFELELYRNCSYILEIDNHDFSNKELERLSRYLENFDSYLIIITKNKKSNTKIDMIYNITAPVNLTSIIKRRLEYVLDTDEYEELIEGYSTSIEHILMEKLKTPYDTERIVNIILESMDFKIFDNKDNWARLFPDYLEEKVHEWFTSEKKSSQEIYWAIVLMVYRDLEWHMFAKKVKEFEDYLNENLEVINNSTVKESLTEYFYDTDDKRLARIHAVTYSKEVFAEYGNTNTRFVRYIDDRTAELYSKIIREQYSEIFALTVKWIGDEGVTTSNQANRSMVKSVKNLIDNNFDHIDSIIIKPWMRKNNRYVNSCLIYFFKLVSEENGQVIDFNKYLVSLKDSKNISDNAVLILILGYVFSKSNPEYCLKMYREILEKSLIKDSKNKKFLKILLIQKNIKFLVNEKSNKDYIIDLIIEWITDWYCEKENENLKSFIYMMFDFVLNIYTENERTKKRNYSLLENFVYLEDGSIENIMYLITRIYNNREYRHIILDTFSCWFNHTKDEQIQDCGLYQFMLNAFLASSRYQKSFIKIINNEFIKIDKQATKDLVDYIESEA